MVFRDVERPYSLTLAQDPERGIGQRLVLQLIERNEDLLVLPVFGTGSGGIDEPFHFGSISGTISGRSEEPGASVFVFARSMEKPGLLRDEPLEAVAAGDSFTLPPVEWWGEATHSFKLHAIEHARNFSAATQVVTLVHDPDEFGATVTDAVLRPGRTGGRARNRGHA